MKLELRGKLDSTDIIEGPHHYAIVMDAEYIRIICEGLAPTRSKQSE